MGIEQEAYVERESTLREESNERNEREWDEDTPDWKGTHEAIMRAMGLDEKYENMLWDASHS